MVPLLEALQDEQVIVCESPCTLHMPGIKGIIFPPGNENGKCIGEIQQQAQKALAAVVTITFDRADYLRRHIDSLLAVHGSSSHYGSVLFPQMT